MGEKLEHAVAERSHSKGKRSGARLHRRRKISRKRNLRHASLLSPSRRPECPQTVRIVVGGDPVQEITLADAFLDERNVRRFDAKDGMRR
jgi:hypothetical protein